MIMNKVYQNTEPGPIPVYADSSKSQQIGRLFARSSCLCIGEQEGLAIVLYKTNVNVPNTFKVGFVDAAGMQA